jgi:hypothetical protein
MAERTSVPYLGSDFVLFLFFKWSYFTTIWGWAGSGVEFTDEPNLVYQAAHVVPIELPLPIQHDAVLLTIVIVGLVFAPGRLLNNDPALRPAPGSRGESSISFHAYPVE